MCICFSFVVVVGIVSIISLLSILCVFGTKNEIS